MIINQVDTFEANQATNAISLPIAAEASWVNGRWDKLAEYISKATLGAKGDFNIEIGSALLALQEKNEDSFFHIINELRSSIAKGLTPGTTSSLQSCHEAMLRFHILNEVELISGFKPAADFDRPSLLTTLDRRLTVFGAFSSDKQYLLGLRRAAMQLSKYEYRSFLKYSANIAIASTCCPLTSHQRGSQVRGYSGKGDLHAKHLVQCSRLLSWVINRPL